MADPILVAESKEQVFLLPKMANRHGLIAGATGTGENGHASSARREFQRAWCTGVHGGRKRRSRGIESTGRK
jgi:uncharacterized protein